MGYSLALLRVTEGILWQKTTSSEEMRVWWSLLIRRIVGLIICFWGQSLMCLRRSWAVILAGEEGLEPQVIYSKLFILSLLLLILFLTLIISSWCGLSLLRLIAFGHDLMLPDQSMVLFSISVSQPHRSCIFLVLLTALRSHHHDLYLRPLLLYYFINLSSTISSRRPLAPVWWYQIVLAMLIWEKHLVFLSSFRRV